MTAEEYLKDVMYRIRQRMAEDPEYFKNISTLCKLCGESIATHDH